MVDNEWKLLELFLKKMNGFVANVRVWRKILQMKIITITKFTISILMRFWIHLKINKQ